MTLKNESYYLARSMINNSSGMCRFTVGSFGNRARHHLGQIQCYCLLICNRILAIFVVEAGSTVVPITKSSVGVLGSGLESLGISSESLSGSACAASSQSP